MSNKSKGCNAERELIHLFWANEWAAVRIAGSGSSQYPSHDVLASNNKRNISIEAKSTRKNNKYFPEEEIYALRQFSERFGAEAWIAIKFLRENWYFVKINDLDQTGKNYVISNKLAKEKGISFNNLIEEK